MFLSTVLIDIVSPVDVAEHKYFRTTQKGLRNGGEFIFGSHSLVKIWAYNCHLKFVKIIRFPEITKIALEARSWSCPTYSCQIQVILEDYSRMQLPKYHSGHGNSVITVFTPKHCTKNCQIWQVLHVYEYSCWQAKTLNMDTQLWKVWHVLKPHKNPFNVEASTQFFDLYKKNFYI